VPSFVDQPLDAVSVHPRGSNQADSQDAALADSHVRNPKISVGGQVMPCCFSQPNHKSASRTGSHPLFFSEPPHETIKEPIVRLKLEEFRRKRAIKNSRREKKQNAAGKSQKLQCKAIPQLD
jgi:hypothetical protein